MINRNRSFDEILDRLTYYPGVVLLGARQVGKSTLARDIVQSTPNAVYLDLELPVDRAKLDNPSVFFAANRDRLVVLDEIQALPNIFTALRPEIDADRRPGRFLMLGSASRVLLRQTAESLAGRVSYLELPPLMEYEVFPHAPAKQSTGDLSPLLQFWQRGGFPLAYGARTQAQSMRWRNDYIQSVLQRDLPTLGITIPSQTLGRFLRMLAHQNGQLFNASALAVSMGGISHTTINKYLDIFCDALLVRRVEPYFVNLGKRLVKSPKVYFRDAGLLHALLDIGDVTQLQGHPISGFSWEGLVMNHLAALLPYIANGAATLNFYRTAAGAELDAIIDTGAERIGFEIKLSEAPRVTKGFWQACADLQISRAYVVAPVVTGWPLGDTAEVIPLSALSRVLGLESLNSNS